MLNSIMHNNRVTIITAVYNGDSTLKNLIDSIYCQTSKPYEFIIIDGGSTDSSLSIIRSNANKITSWLSEKDNGIYDAWNKGLKLATGDWIMFLGADDLLAPNAIADYINFINRNPNNQFDYVSSKVQMINRNGLPIWINGKSWQWPYFKYKMIVAHPGSRHSKRLYQKFGNYDLSYRIVGDYEFLLRPGAYLNAGFLDMVTVNMSEGGVSDSWNAIWEYFNATTKTGKANRLLVYLIGSYVFVKAKLNTILREYGLNFNVDR